MGWEPWIHFAHVIAAIVWVGGGAAVSLVAWRVRRSGDIAVFRELAGVQSFLGLTVFLPSIVVVLLSGIWLVLDFSGDFTKLWLVLGIGAFVAAFLIGAVFLSRSAIRFDRLAKSGDLEGARSALGSWMVGYAVVLAILVFAVWDMVFKPGTGG
jgi:uncharacterized membrane protein (DUF485 family)